MLKSFLDRLKGDAAADTPFDESDARTAVAALLVHAAHIDDDYSDTEKGLIEAILAHRYSLGPDEARALREEGEAADETSVDTYRFTHLIKTGLSMPERLTVLEALWSVVLSDQTRDDSEDNLVRRLVETMGMNSHDSAHARQRVEAAMRS